MSGVMGRSKLKDVTCPICNTVFKTDRINRKYCSRECGEVANAKNSEYRRRAEVRKYFVASDILCLKRCLVHVKNNHPVNLDQIETTLDKVNWVLKEVFEI